MLSIARTAASQGLVQNPAAWVFTFVLVVVFPITDYLLYFRLKSTLGLYVWNLLAEWSLVAGCIWVLRSNGLGLADIGEGLRSPLRALVSTGSLFIVVAVLVIVSKRRPKRTSAEQMSKAASQVRRLLPVTRTERRVWIGVAFTAGMCEEFLYRGWLLTLIGTALGSVWAGLIISSIVFGVAHAYQGRRGMIGASVLGVVFGAVFILSNTLFLGQILHAAIDLNNGLALGKAVAPEGKGA